MKTLLTMILAITFSMNSIAQTRLKTPTSTNVESKESLKIIFQYTVKDTAYQRTFMKQLANIQKVAPDTKIEVVCHGPGLDLLQKEKSLVADKIALLVENGIVFNACEFAMSEKKITKDQIIPSATYVKAGVIEIAIKQAEGWSYIKSGF